MESGKNHRRELGKFGEDLACSFLQGMGHTVLERNWRCGHLEIDIISFDSDGIHFVEVKTRSENIQAPPQDSVNRQKQQNIISAAKRFLRSSKGLPHSSSECFFDVFAVTFKGGVCSTEWIPQAYIPIYK